MPDTSDLAESGMILTSFDSPYGLYSCDWRIEGGKIEGGDRGTAERGGKSGVPGVAEVVGSGEEGYDVEWKEDPRWPPPVPSSVQAKDGFEPQVRIELLVKA